jgi:hypothetical protein
VVRRAAPRPYNDAPAGEHREPREHREQPREPQQGGE